MPDDIDHLKKYRLPSVPPSPSESEIGAPLGATRGGGGHVNREAIYRGGGRVPPSPSESEADRMFLPTIGGYEYSPAADGAEAFGGSEEGPEGPVDKDALKDRVTLVLKDVYDPEIPVNIHDLGLIYGLEVDDEANVQVEMTLTAPACPVAGALVQEVAERVGQTQGVRRSHVKLVFDPPWTQDRMTEEAKLELGLL
jgi:FeS assembly SUF system protein